jgi:hypothetical protein
VFGDKIEVCQNKSLQNCNANNVSGWRPIEEPPPDDNN